MLAEAERSARPAFGGPSEADTDPASTTRPGASGQGASDLLHILWRTAPCGRFRMQQMLRTEMAQMPELRSLGEGDRYHLSGVQPCAFHRTRTRPAIFEILNITLDAAFASVRSSDPWQPL